jgi:predicted RNase H-like nuclease
MREAVVARSAKGDVAIEEAERANQESQPRRAILGIDAAWTERQPSGVALAVEAEGGWRLAAVEASYAGFVAHADGVSPGGERLRGAMPDAAKLLEAALKICGRPVDLIAVDMPLSRHPIVARRPCDNQISSRFGAAGAGVHSPNENRPGLLSDALRAAFEAEGYALRTTRDDPSRLARGLVEVYPHTALIRFFSEKRRLEYKAGKTLTYWPKLSRDDRRVKLRSVWTRILEALDRRIAGVAEMLPLPGLEAKGWRLKAYEDKLDAVVCAAVAIACLNGEAQAYGDENAAIWVPCAEAAG